MNTRHAVLLSVILGACGGSAAAQPATPRPHPGIPERVARLERSVTTLQQRLTAAEDRLKTLEARKVSVVVGTDVSPSLPRGIRDGEAESKCPAGKVAVRLNHGGTNNDWWLMCASVSVR